MRFALDKLVIILHVEMCAGEKFRLKIYRCTLSLVSVVCNKQHSTEQMTFDKKFASKLEILGTIRYTYEKIKNVNFPDKLLKGNVCISLVVLINLFSFIS